MSAEASTDVRLPIGGLFLVLGLIVGGFGLATIGDAARYARSGGLNINLWWGLVMFAFGLILVVFARRGSRASRAPLTVR